MTIDALIMLAGGFVAVLPFLGFPNSWDAVFLFVVGLSTVGLGIVVRRKIGTPSRSGADTFVENLPSRQSGMPRESTHDSA